MASMKAGRFVFISIIPVPSTVSNRPGDVITHCPKCRGYLAQRDVNTLLKPAIPTQEAGE